MDPDPNDRLGDGCGILIGLLAVAPFWTVVAGLYGWRGILIGLLAS
jgi:hypothetical protein